MWVRFDMVWELREVVFLAASVIVVARKDGLFRSWGPH